VDPKYSRSSIALSSKRMYWQSFVCPLLSFQSALPMASMRGANPGPGTTAAAWNGVFAYRAAMHATEKMPVEEPITGSCESGAFSPAPWRRRHNENGHGIVKGLP
jgi:hypothetical protein